MKRQPLMHDRVFDDPGFAETYAAKHEGMGRKLGKMVAGRDLASRGFSGGSILDAGCGPGFMLIEILKLFPNSQGIGIDLAEPLLAVGRKIADAEGLADRVKFESGDVEKLPYEDNSFDCVVSINMLHIVENPVKQLDEIERVLKPDGLYLIADIKRSWLVSLFEKESKSAFTAKEAGELIAQSSLRKGKPTNGFIWWEYRG
jgi:ubiquinone/menaquinone biosynthesis C-methylase UbiE